jgi:hypothetical protein
MAKKKSLDDLKEGDLVLIPHYFSGEKERKGVPEWMVLGKVEERLSSGGFFSSQMSVLHQAYPGDVLPRVSQDYGGSEYVCRKVNWGPKSGWLFHNSDCVSNGEIYVGLKEVLNALEKTPEYAPHAASLRATTTGRLASVR